MTNQFKNELEMGIAIKNGKLLYPNEALDYMLETTTGNLLGDAGLVTDAKPSNITGFSLQFSSSRRQYIDHLYNVYSPWTRAKIYDKNRGRISTVTNEPLGPCYGFITRVQKVLLSYKNWRKVVPVTATSKGVPTQKLKVVKILPSNIEDLLTRRGIAYWFMDDGAIHKLGCKGFVICTDSFSRQEVEILVEILKNKFGVNCKIFKVTTKKGETQFRIRILTSGHDTFREIVKPYILPCFEYKINPI